MEPGAIALLIPIFSVVGFFVMMIYLRRYANEERMAMIEKGIDPTLFTTKARSFSGTLQLACLFIGGGLGLLVGYMLDSMTDMREVAYFASLFIFGGVGLLISYFMDEQKIKREKM